jgi:hypothetical protein
MKINGKKISYISDQMSYGYLRVYVKQDGEEIEHRIGTEELTRILKSQKFEVVPKKCYPHLEMI